MADRPTPAQLAATDDGSIVKHSVNIAGHRTSISLEAPFWAALREIADADGTSIAALITEIDANRRGNLSSALRVYVLARVKLGIGPAPAP
jgi:predicted DNA-binding ribbon-helix-helix protein